MKTTYLLIIPFYIACANIEPDVELVAIVNGVPITKAQLVSRIELTPMLKSSANMDLVEEALNITIDEIVVSIWSRKRRLDYTSDYKNRISFTRRQALIRELYYTEIRDRSIPTEREINNALEKSLKQVTIEILLTKERDISVEWGNLIQAGKSFSELEGVYDSNLYVQKTVVSFHWGDSNVPIKIQIISYETIVGGMSDVFSVPLGYGVLSVRKRVKDNLNNSSAPNLTRQEVSKIIQARNEDRLASKYAEKLLKDIKVEQIGRGFIEIKKYLESNAYLNAEDAASEKYVKDIELKSGEAYDLSLAIVKSPDFEWDGNDVLKLLEQYNYSVSAEGVESISKSLTLFLKSAVRDYYLEKRAEHLGLGNNVRVMEDVDMWSRYYLYLGGISEMIIVDTTGSTKESIRKEIDKMRSKANIVLKQEVIKTINITGIPMMVLWNGTFSRNLAVPPLVRL